MKRIIVYTVIILFVVTAVFAAEDLIRTKRTASDVNVGVPRYQIIAPTIARVDLFLLDTQTGDIWSLVTYTDLNGEPRAWQPIPRLPNPGTQTVEEIIKEHGFKKEDVLNR